ncbi:unnamed protein product [Medioppia subpectinata]|uniref:Ribosome biogenesis protein WDR12 homolog n=1 Tax=Medioppia subpectinata TaxID=1979941 RepID=A0A7R9PYK4_9ACAR|nr:unnamed protein product [Medioppia subpectinata]CAG2105994.1 unnamed protein product [Medioppia subpectinata]
MNAILLLSFILCANEVLSQDGYGLRPFESFEPKVGHQSQQRYDLDSNELDDQIISRGGEDSESLSTPLRSSAPDVMPGASYVMQSEKFVTPEYRSHWNRFSHLHDQHESNTSRVCLRVRWGPFVMHFKCHFMSNQHFNDWIPICLIIASYFLFYRTNFRLRRQHINSGHVIRKPHSMQSMDTNESEDKSCRQFVANFVTKDQRLSIPSVPYSLNGSTHALDLNALIKTLLAEDNDHQNDVNLEEIDFDFAINGKLLRLSIEEFVENERLVAENQIEIEFFVKSCPPKPHNSLLHDDWVSCVDCTHNWIISGCYDNSVHIWDLNNDGSHKIAIPAHLAPVKDIQWIGGHLDDGSDDHMFVSSSHDETAIVWKWNSLSNQVEYLFSCRGHSRSVDCVDVNNDLLATGSYDQMLKIWSLVDDKKETESSEASTSQKKMKKNDGSVSGDRNRTPIITLSGHKEAVTSCAWMKESTTGDTSVVNIATTSMDNTIRLWDIEVGESKQTLTSNKAFLSISYSPLNHCLITGSCDRHIRLWDPRASTGSLVAGVYSSHQSWVSSIDFSKTNEFQFISGSYDNIVKQWDIRSPDAPLYDLIGHDDKVLCVNWSSDEYMISGSADNQLKIFSNSDKKSIK